MHESSALMELGFPDKVLQSPHNFTHVICQVAYTCEGQDGQLNRNVWSGSAADVKTQEEQWSGVQEEGSTCASGKALGGTNWEGSTAERCGFVDTGKLGLCSFSPCFQADQLTFTSWASERCRKKKLPQDKSRSLCCMCTQWIKTWNFADSISFSIYNAGILCLIFPRCVLASDIQVIKRLTLAHYRVIFVIARGLTHRLKNCKIDRGKGVTVKNHPASFFLIWLFSHLFFFLVSIQTHSWAWFHDSAWTLSILLLQNLSHFDKLYYCLCDYRRISTLVGASGAGGSPLPSVCHCSPASLHTVGHCPCPLSLSQTCWGGPVSHCLGHWGGCSVPGASSEKCHTWLVATWGSLSLLTFLVC